MGRNNNNNIKKKVKNCHRLHLCAKTGFSVTFYWSMWKAPKVTIKEREEEEGRAII